MATATTYELIGKKTVYIGAEEFPPDLVSDEAATITVTPATTEISSQMGKIKVPNGTFDEISAKITLIVNNIQTLMRIFPGMAKKATFNSGATGQVIFGATECKSVTPVPVVIHNACDDGSSQDIQIPSAYIANGGEFKLKQGDPVTIELNITPLSGEKGAIIMGEGMLDSASHYDAVSQSYKKNATTPAVSQPAGH